MPTKEEKLKFDPALVLKDIKNYPDDTEIPFGNGVMTLGAFRAYDQATRGELQTALERDRKELEAERKKIDAASQSVAKLYVEVEKQRADLDNRAAELAQSTPAHRASAGSTTDPLEEVLNNDPVYQRLSKTIASYEDKLKALDKKLDEGFGKVSSTLNEVGSTYLQERYEKDFDGIMSREDAARPKDLSLEGLYKYANDNSIKKRNGIIDLNRAYDQMTQPARMKLEIEKAREAGRAEALKERDLNNMMPKPTQGLTIPGLDNIIQGRSAPKNLDEAFAAAAQDPLMFTTPTQ